MNKHKSQKLWRVLYSDVQDREELSKDPQVKKSIHQLYKTISTEEPDYDLLWQRIQKDCGIKQKSFRRYWQIAAAAFVPLFLGIGSYFLWFSKDATPPTAPFETLQGVRLTLANGTKISLHDSSQTTLLHQQGIVLQQDTSRQKIQYTSQNSAGPTLEYNTLEVPIATDFQIELSDGTTVFLNADSRLKYPTSFGSTERKVYLEGEAYFEVSKDQNRPFRVETKDAVIEVLGTSFNINAYPEQPTSTTLATGKVQINKGKQQILLQPGEQACCTDTGFIVSSVDVREFISWKDGLFIFNNMSLEQIMRQMERWYGLSVTFMDPEVKKYTFTGMINKHLVPEETFSVIQKTINVQFTISDKQVIIKK